jgi:hypothetical protein
MDPDSQWPGYIIGLIIVAIATFFTYQYFAGGFPFQPPTPNIPIVLSHYISAEKLSFDQNHAYLNTQSLGAVLSPSEVVSLRPSQGSLSNNSPQITVTTNPPQAKEKYVCITDNYERATNSYTYIAVALVNNHVEIYHGPYQPTCVPSLANPGVINDYRRM